MQEIFERAEELGWNTSPWGNFVHPGQNSSHHALTPMLWLQQQPPFEEPCLSCSLRPAGLHGRVRTVAAVSPDFLFLLEHI